MKKEYRKVVTLEEEDVDKARELAKALLEVANDKELNEDYRQRIHNAIFYLEDIEQEYNN